jgi:hypothetical protein
LQNSSKMTGWLKTGFPEIMTALAGKTASLAYP